MLPAGGRPGGGGEGGREGATGGQLTVHTESISVRRSPPAADDPRDRYRQIQTDADRYRQIHYRDRYSFHGQNSYMQEPYTRRQV